MDKFLFFVARKGRVLSPIVPWYDFGLSRKFLLIILIEKREIFNWGVEGLWPPIGLTKISKKGGVMDRCLKMEIFITLHFWGVKGGEKVH